MRDEEEKMEEEKEVSKKSVPKKATQSARKSLAKVATEEEDIDELLKRKIVPE